MHCNPEKNPINLAQNPNIQYKNIENAAAHTSSLADSLRNLNIHATTASSRTRPRAYALGDLSEALPSLRLNKKT